MGTTADKLQKLVENKNAIKGAFEEFGMLPSENMSEYPQLIKDLGNSYAMLKDVIEGNLTTISVPNGVTRIKDRTFFVEQNSTSVIVDTLYLPKTITEIGKSIMLNSNSVSGMTANIHYQGNLEEFINIKRTNSREEYNDILYANHSMKLFLNDSENYVTEIDLTNSNIEELKTGVFSRLNFIQTFKFPKTLKSIGSYCFNKIGDYNVRTFSFEEGTVLNNVDPYAFRYVKLTSVKEFKLPRITDTSNFNSGSYQFQNFQVEIFNLENFEEIPQYFSPYLTVTELKLSDSVKQIYANAFENIKSTQPIFLPKSLEKIYVRSFYTSNNITFVVESETPFTITTNSFYARNGLKIYVPKGTSATFKNATNWSYFADYILEPYSVSVVFPPQLVNNEAVTYSIDGGKTYKQFTSDGLSLGEVAVLKIKSKDSTQTILIGTTSGGSNLGTISNSEITLSFTTDTTIYLTIQ